MNPLQRLITERLEERGWSYGQVARRAGMPRSTVHNLATRQVLSRPPARETLERLSVGLDLSLERVQAAAAEAAGFRLYEEHPEESVRVLMASMEELSTDDRQQVLALVEKLLRKNSAQ